MRESGLRDGTGSTTASGTAQDPAPTAAPSQDVSLHLTVQRDILSLAARMAAALDISVPDETWPSVHLSATAPTSSYSRSQNSITIATRHLNDGFMYGEEVTHFLRTLMSPPPVSESTPADEMIFYRAIQELCGRLGRDFAQRVSEGSHLSALFEGTSPRDGQEFLGSAEASAGKVVGALSQREKESLEFQRSATLFGGLLDELDKSLHEEWQPTSTSFPGATALLKQRVTELFNSPDAPSSAQARLRTILEFLTPREELNQYEIEKARDVLRGCRDADEHRAATIGLENSATALAFKDAEIHARAYLDAEAIMTKHPDSWPEHFKKIMRLSVSELRDPQGFLAKNL